MAAQRPETGASQPPCTRQAAQSVSGCLHGQYCRLAGQTTEADQRTRRTAPAPAPACLVVRCPVFPADGRSIDDRWLRIRLNSSRHEGEGCSGPRRRPAGALHRRGYGDEEDADAALGPAAGSAPRGPGAEGQHQRDGRTGRGGE